MNLKTFAMLFLAGFASAAPASAVTADATPVSAAQRLGFVDHTVVANGVKLHYVTIGKGEPVVLIPGWPESWYAWRFVMRRLADAGRLVYAIDPRGFGDSEAPPDGYDLATSAKDMHAFLEITGLARPGGVDIIAHDIGNWIAYAHASTYPQDVRRLVLSEAPLPGSAKQPTPTDVQNLRTWQFSFNRLPGLPEQLVGGREREYLTYIYTTKATKTAPFDAAAIDEYTRVFSKPSVLRAGFDYYRQAYSDAGLMQMQTWAANKLAMPVFTIAGDGSLGPIMQKVIEPYATDVHGVVLAGCGHFVAEECPDEYVRSISTFWSVAASETATR
jgi:pimeloyl-ACP methyl ester carboxylesterase